MWNPFEFLFKKRKTTNDGNISEIPSPINNSVQHETITANEIDNVVESEREKLLQSIDITKLKYILLRGELDMNTISIEFLRKLSYTPTLLDFIFNNIFDANKIKRIIAGNFRLSDIEYYKEEIFSYDIFADEDKELVDKLRKNIDIADLGYAAFSYDEFNSFIDAYEYLEDYIEPLIGEEKIFIKRTKASLLPGNSVFYSAREAKIYQPLVQNNIIQRGMFDYYYSGKLEFNKDTIISISFDEFLDWIKDDRKREILTKVQVSINNYYNAYAIKRYDTLLPNTFFDTNNDKINIQVNHLLYTIENSNLDEDKRNYYSYQVKTYLNYINNSMYGFDYMNKLQELTEQIKEEIDLDNVNKHTLEFNKLSPEEKNKKIAPPLFSSKIFLSQFESLDNISAFELLDNIKILNKEDKTIVLKEEVIIEKLKELLKESNYDEYKGYKIFCKILDLDLIFEIFDADFIEKFYKKNREFNKYRLYYSILEYNDVNKGIDILFNNEKHFRQFLDCLYYLSDPLSKLNYDTLVKLLKKVEKGNYSNVDLSFISSFDIEEQFNLLKEDFNNNFLVKIVTSSSKKVQQFFYKEDIRFTYLWERFDILGLSQNGYIFNDDVVNKKEFLDKFKGNSMITFRANVNRFLINQGDIYFEERITKYEDEMISDFDINTGLFNQYKWLIDNINFLVDKNFSYIGIDFFYDSKTNYECRKFIAIDDEDNIYIKDEEGLFNYLAWLSKAKLNEIIIDRLFKDNIYNVFLNIKEMIRYNKQLNDNEKVLNDEMCEFYNTVLNIDKLDNDKIIEFYNKFKDKNVALMFYDDVRKLKDLSYQKIKQDMIKPEEMAGMEDKELSNKYGVPIYDLRDKEYVMLIRCLNWEHNPLNHNKRDCYTILSNDNSSVIRDDAFIYGYSDFNDDCVLHIFEGDSFSGDVKNDELSVGSDRVNRIMTSREIANTSHWYSEVQIVNKKSNDNKGLFETLIPSFLVVYDEINEKILKEAKRKNIPIYIISHSLNKDVVKDFEATGVIEELRYTREWGMHNEVERRKNR